MATGIKATKQITQFTGFDVQMPSTDGQRIVFLQAGTLYVMETPANTYRKITVNIPTDGWKLATRTINPKEFIHSFSPLWKGEGALFEARGDIFIVAKAPLGLRGSVGDQRVEPGLHFGHRTKRRNPKMRQYLFGQKNGIYLLDLEQTLDGLQTVSYTPLTLPTNYPV